MAILSTGYTQEKGTVEHLGNINKLITVNRSISLETEKESGYIRVSEAKGEGLVWLPIEHFTTGTIQVELRGKDVFQQSFIGIAFSGQNNETYEAVYCRPFNFLAKDSVRRIHAVQYIAHPEYTWKRLREERNGVFEKEIKNPPNPSDWFTMTLKITENQVVVIINNSADPSLTVTRIHPNQKGKIGLYTGDSSGGDFRNLVYTHN
ncbi:hypothetical protein [Flavihumibacter sp. UBA7668]|uniref:hypothetical protein n=1 Tax=Flavihumibacter sp. UBA7668 TaxID=1946542 RepID=UPI0025C72A09|nr:hypothetical protein [Flavihumibacter sp. UBA7668]